MRVKNNSKLALGVRTGVNFAIPVLGAVTKTIAIDNFS